MDSYGKKPRLQPSTRELVSVITHSPKAEVSKTLLAILQKLTITVSNNPVVLLHLPPAKLIQLLPYSTKRPWVAFTINCQLACENSLVNPGYVQSSPNTVIFFHALHQLFNLENIAKRLI